jgi:DNA-binding NtrC family response regulator
LAELDGQGTKTRIMERYPPMDTSARDPIAKNPRYLPDSAGWPDPRPVDPQGVDSRFAHPGRTEGMRITEGLLRCLREARLGVVPRELGVNAVTLSGYLRAAPPQHTHEVLEPIVAGDPRYLGMSGTQRLEILTVFLRNCFSLGHPGCFARWGAELETLSMKHLGTAPDEAVCGLRLTMIWRDSFGEYSRARALGDRIPAPTLSMCSVATRAGLAFARTGVAIRLGDLDTAEMVGAQAVDVADQSGDAGLRGLARVCLATALKQRGRFPEALSLYTQAEAFHQLSGDLVGMARSQLNRGLLLNRLGWVREAATILECAHRRAREIAQPQLVLRTGLGLGLVAVRRGEFDEGRRRLLQGWLEARRLRMPREQALALEFLGEALILVGRLSTARRILALCRRTAERMAPEGDLIAECGIREALLSLVAGDPAQAWKAADTARACAAKTGLPWEESQALRLGAIALYRLDRRAEARTDLLAARSRLRAMNEQLEIRLVDRWLEFLDNEGDRDGHGDGHGEGRNEGRNEGRSDSRSEEPPIHPAQTSLLAERTLGANVGMAPETVPEVAATRASGMDASPPARASGNGAPSSWYLAVPAKIPSRHPRGRRPEGLHETWQRLGLVTRSPRLLSLLQDAEMMAASGSIVLVQGETGTGKELVARGVHSLSGRNGPLVPVNIGAVLPDLFEAELFGVEKGAYTGAGQSRLGLAVAADSGTLFLDEIGEVGLRGQVALLRFLDSGEVRPVGSTRILHVQLGVVAATNRPLKDLVSRNRFRSDLYYRLAQGVLELPPLRDRLEDLPELVDLLWIRQAGGAKPPAGLLDDDAMGVLRAYAWPGNVRELDHYLRRVRISLARVGETRVTLQRLQGHLGASTESLAKVMPSDRHSKTRSPIVGKAPANPPPDAAEVDRALRAAAGNRSRAARILGIHRGTLYRLIERSDCAAPRARCEGSTGDV